MALTKPGPVSIHCKRFGSAKSTYCYREKFEKRLGLGSQKFTRFFRRAFLNTGRNKTQGKAQEGFRTNFLKPKGFAEKVAGRGHPFF